MYARRCTLSITRVLVLASRHTLASSRNRVRSSMLQHIINKQLRLILSILLVVWYYSRLEYGYYSSLVVE
jgi:hypothetical protein